MNREEAIAYLKELKNSMDICDACPRECMSLDDCDLEAVIEYLDGDGMERLKDALRETRGEI